MINRAAVILRYKEPFVRWINDADPYEDNPGKTPENANKDRNVYLITDEDGETVEEWISLNYKTLFENELEGWYSDESLWPKNRNRKTSPKAISPHPSNTFTCACKKPPCFSTFPIKNAEQQRRSSYQWF